MFEYLYGEITTIYNSYVVLDVNKVGYRIYLVNPSSVSVGEKLKIYIYHHVNESQSILFGFLNVDHKIIFSNLIKMKNIGVKTAYQILNKIDVEALYAAVFNNNDDFLLKIPKINKNNLEQFKKIILKIRSSHIDMKIYKSELFNLLVNLEYNVNEIIGIYDKVDKSKTMSDQLKEAIEYLDKEKK